MTPAQLFSLMKASRPGREDEPTTEEEAEANLMALAQLKIRG